MKRRDVLLTGAAAALAPTLPALASPSVVGVRKPTVFLIPSIMLSEGVTRHFDEKNNWITLEHHYMDLLDTSSDNLFRYSNVPVTHDYYQDMCDLWLHDRGYTAEVRPAIPPHIGFGGAIKSGKGDTTFKDRWTLETAARLIRHKALGTYTIEGYP